MGGQNKATKPGDLRRDGERRKALRQRRDEWLRLHRHRCEYETSNALALEMRREGLFSPKTAVIDIIVSIEGGCGRLGIPTRLRKFKGLC